jgi:hypothetical protein
MKDTETELGLDKSILAAQYSLNTLIQRFREAEQSLPPNLLSQIIKLQESLDDALNLDWDVRAGLTITALSQPSSQIK